jgi:hypothetical protein
VHHFINPVSSAVKAAGEQNGFAATIRGLFPVQRDYVMCADPIVANHAARRSGKSAGNVRRLIRRAARHPDGLAFFGAKDIKTCKRIIGPTVREVSREYNLGFEWSSQDSAFIAPNGYQLWLLGLSEDGEADKLRGAAHGLVEGVIDECATIPDDVLKYAVLQCALPALGETGGRLALSGTPGPLMSGFFYEQCQTRKAFHWDARQNPFLRIPGAKYLDNALKNNPTWTWETPTFKREYLGLWCEDRDMLVYPYAAARNLIYQGSEFPEGRTILGVDVGFEDGNGYCVTRSQPPNNPEIHVLRCYEKRHQKLPAMAAEIESLRRHYGCNYIFIDEGNNGLMVSKTLCEMGIPCKPTPKGLKRPRIEVVRGGLAAGTIKVVRGHCDTLVGEWGMLPWNEKQSDVDDRYSNECSDAAIYAILPHRQSYQHLLEEAPEGSVARINKAQESDKEREERESINAADLDKMSAHMNRVRGVVQDWTTPKNDMLPRRNWR